MSLEMIRNQYFPLQLPANTSARWVSKEVAFEVGAATHIFDPAAIGMYAVPAERAAQVAEARARFNFPGAEAFAFYDEAERPIGWAWAYMENSESFTLDTFGLLREFRGQGIYRAFMRVLLAYLKDLGYERVTVYTHPNNRAMLIANLKLGFNIGGMEMNASTGILVKLIYQLHPDRRADFSRAFRLLPDDYPETELREP